MRSVLLAVPAIATVFLAVGCGSTVSAPEVENQIASALEEETGFPVDSVSCPDDLDAEVGATLRCELTVDDTAYGVDVEVSGLEGDVAEFDIQVDDEPLN